MKMIHYVFFGTLVLAALVAQFDISRRVNKNTQIAEAAKATVKQSQEGEKTFNNQPLTIENYTADQASKKFVEKFKKESLEISKIQNNPEEAQRRLKELANEMTPADVQNLYEVMSNENNDGDQRALAVELLSLKNDTSSLLALQNFVANSTTINGTKWDRKKELETVLRAQAIESIAAYPQRDIAVSTLNFLQEKVDEKFLSDRIGRAAAGLQKKDVFTIEQQDNEALEELIE